MLAPSILAGINLTSAGWTHQPEVVAARKHVPRMDQPHPSPSVHRCVAEIRVIDDLGRKDAIPFRPQRFTPGFGVLDTTENLDLFLVRLFIDGENNDDGARTAAMLLPKRVNGLRHG